MTIDMGDTIILAFFDDTIMAFSPVAPLLAWAFIIALVAMEFVPRAYTSTYDGNSSLRALTTWAPMPPPIPSITAIIILKFPLILVLF